MKDPQKAPGYHFQWIRVRSASCQIHAIPAQAAQAELDVNYLDKVEVDDAAVTLVQSITVRATEVGSPNNLWLTVAVEIEGRFVGVGEVNFDPAEFGDQVAPSLLLPFAREWIYKLTSASHPLPPVLLPPLNIRSIRERIKRVSAEGGAGPSK